MTIVLIRTIILYLIVLFVIRIMGKGELSKMSPFQLIVLFMIAELASIPIESPDVSMITGVTAIFTLLFLQVLISFISIKSEKLKNFFNGKPSILINNGDINHKELKKLRITVNDLMEQLRIGNMPAVSDVEYAVMESNGELSIIPKAENKPLTPKDMSIKKQPEIMPVVFISDGIMYRKNLTQAGWTEEKLLKNLSMMNISSCSDVFLAFCDSESRLHIYMHYGKNNMAKEITE
ncbi:MAG: DUF421 domain-containing protein [Bacillota bacterium]|nr:DUF421 domain-containing protein [Bacillota bacterium]